MTIIGNIEPMKMRFWMVYGEGQRCPTYKHDTRQSAEEECARLARENPGIAFYALKAVSATERPVADIVVTPLVKRRAVGDDGIPF